MPYQCSAIYEGIDLEISASEMGKLNETFAKHADYILQQALAS